MLQNKPSALFGAKLIFYATQALSHNIDLSVLTYLIILCKSSTSIIAANSQFRRPPKLKKVLFCHIRHVRNHKKQYFKESEVSESAKSIVFTNPSQQKAEKVIFIAILHPKTP